MPMREDCHKNASAYYVKIDEDLFKMAIPVWM
jgi:hypothetical protein